jgi:hypothetical protein
VGLPDATIRVAVVGYISEVEWFWNNKAAKVYFDVNGEKFKFNMWPERGSNKAAQVPKDAIGSVAILCCNRYMEKEFSLDAIVVVQAPINLKEESQ